MRTLRFLPFVTALVVHTASSALVFAQQPVNPDLAQAYYLETERRDPAAAVTYYERVLKNADVDASDREMARLRLERCREAAKVVDLARLMPAESLFYVEISRPGEHLAQLAGALGMSTKESNVVGETRAPRMEFHDGFGLPVDFQISPALLDELANINGAAVAVTGIDKHGPLGVVLIDAGNSNLVRGIVETGLQVFKPAESIEGFKTYSVEDDVWITATHRLVVASRSRDAIVNVLRQMNDASALGVTQHSAFLQARSQSTDPLVFAFVAGSTLQKTLLEHAEPREAMIANAMLDLEHLQYVSAALNTAGAKIALDARIQLTEGHRNLAYGLIRTAPISGENRGRLPSAAAAYVAMGINETGLIPKSSSEQNVMSLLDLGREVFANMQEISAFLLPSMASDSRHPVPNMGFVIAAADVNRSQQLWNQLLAMPSRLGIPETQQPREITIAGHPATEFRLPDAPSIVLCRASDRHLVAGTRDAVQAALKEHGEIHVAADQSGPAHKLVEIDIDRLLALLATVEPNSAREINQARSLLPDLAVSLATYEQDNSFQIHGEIRGLPQLRMILEQVGNVQRDRIELVSSDE